MFSYYRILNYRSLTKLMENKLHVATKESRAKKNELAILHSIVRSKGFVWIANHPNRCVFCCFNFFFLVRSKGFVWIANHPNRCV